MLAFMAEAAVAVAEDLTSYMKALRSKKGLSRPCKTAAGG